MCETVPGPGVVNPTHVYGEPPEVCDHDQVIVHWEMTGAEWRELKAVLDGDLGPAQSDFVRRLRAEGKLA